MSRSQSWQNGRGGVVLAAVFRFGTNTSGIEAVLQADTFDSHRSNTPRGEN